MTRQEHISDGFIQMLKDSVNASPNWYPGKLCEYHGCGEPVSVGSDRYCETHVDFVRRRFRKLRNDNNVVGMSVEDVMKLYGYRSEVYAINALVRAKYEVENKIVVRKVRGHESEDFNATRNSKDVRQPGNNNHTRNNGGTPPPDRAKQHKK